MSQQITREEWLDFYNPPAEVERPQPIEGYPWAPADNRHPYIDGLPIMAWLSWVLPSAGVTEEDPVAAALIEALIVARNKDVTDFEAEHILFAVQRATKHYALVVRALNDALRPEAGPMNRADGEGQETDE